MPTKAEQKDDDAIEMSKQWWRDAVEVNEEWLQRAKESFRFYISTGQWDEWDLQKLRDEKRPALTINHCFPLVNMLSGYQRKNRSDITLYPRRAASEGVAAVGTGLIKHTMDVSGGIYEYSDAFFDALICGKGWLGVDRDYRDDPLNGDLEVAKRSAFNILEDQNNRSPILNKGKYVFETYWWDRKKLEMRYPQHAKRLDEAMESPEWQADTYDPMDFEDYGDDRTSLAWRQGAQEREEQFFIRELWYKKAEMVKFVLHKPTMAYQILNDKQFKWSKENNRNPDLVVFERDMEIMHKLITAGELVLEHVRDPLDGIHKFPYFRIVPYWVDGYVMGVLDSIKDPQREVNKRRSQSLHILNTTANAWTRIGSGKKPAALAELRRNGSKPGFIADESKFGGKIERDAPSPLDVAHVTLSEMSKEDIKDISGVNTSLVEVAGEARESGKAKLLRMEAGLTISEPIFDNSNRTEKELGEFLWEVIRKGDIYTQEEVIAVIQEHRIEEFVTADEAGNPQLDLSPLESMALGRYGCKVARSPNVPTMRLANYEMLLRAVEAGLPIPPEFLIELSDLPNKDKIIAFLQKAAQMPQAEPQKMQRRRA